MCVCVIGVVRFFLPFLSFLIKIRLKKDKKLLGEIFPPVTTSLNGAILTSYSIQMVYSSPLGNLTLTLTSNIDIDNLCNNLPSSGLGE